MSDPTAREASNTPLPVVDKRLMDEGIAEKVELLCHIRKTPLVLYGMFLDITRQYYIDGDNLPIDVCATWNQDADKTKLWIGTEYEWEDQTPEFRPAIYIKLSEIKYKSVTGRDDSLVRFDMEEGEYHFSRDGVGSVSWVHIGSTRGESLALAGATFDYVDATSMLIRDDLCFRTFETVEHSALQIDKESRERWRSVVTASFSFEDTWSIKRESPKLKRVIFLARQAMVLNGIVQ